MLTTGNQSDHKEKQFRDRDVGEDKIYESFPNQPKMTNAFPVHQIPLATFDKGSIEYDETTVGYVNRSGASKEGLEKATITQAMESNTSRMSNPLNHFAYSDRMKPTHNPITKLSNPPHETHNPIKVKCIAFDDQKQIREVERGHSKLEVEHPIVSATGPNRHNEIISAGSGPTSQSRPTVQN